MVPSAYKLMHGFPKTINGKTDKKALIFEANEFDEIDGSDEIDFTPNEKQIYEIWSDILKVKNISKTDSFFEIGGNSLLSIRLLNKLKEKLGISMTFRELISNSTIYHLGLLVEDQVVDSKGIELIHLTESLNLPLTINQKRLWVISKLQPDLATYIIRFSYKFTGSLDCKVFEKSLDILFQRHHIVFSVIREKNSEPYCDIVPSKVNISFIDYSEVPENEKSEKVWDVINKNSLKVFDLENGPLYRLYLIKTSDNEHYFHMSIHHIIFDGWSQGVMINDLNKIYNSLLVGK